MALLKLKKEPWECITIAGDFSSVLADGVTIEPSPLSVVTAVDSDRIDVSTTFLNQATLTIDGSLLKIRCLEGINGKVYSVNFKIQTSLGDKFETNMRITVKEVGYVALTTTTTTV